MKTSIKVLFFFVLVFVIGMFYNILNMGLVPLEEALDNTTGLPHDPYPTIDTVYNFLWLAVPILAVISTALYLAMEKRSL